MGTPDPVSRLLALPVADLEREVALRYEEGLIALQRRMHPGAVDRPIPEGIILHPSPMVSSTPGEGESPQQLADHGRHVAEAIFEPVRDEVCTDRQKHPREFSRSGSAIPRLVHYVTRADPPDEMFVAAACLLWKRGLDLYCASTPTTPDGPNASGGA